MRDINFSIHFWNKLAARYAKKPVPNEAIYQQKLKWTQQYLSQTDLVFEFGCGTGSTALQHAPKVSKIEATDISPAMIDIAKSRAQEANIPNITFAVGQIEMLDIKPNTYNAVLGLNVMHLVDEPATTLQHIWRVLKEDGVFISSTPLLKNESFLVRSIIKCMQLLRKAPFINLMTQDDYTNLVTQAGFELVHTWAPTKSSLFLVARKPSSKGINSSKPNLI